MKTLGITLGILVLLLVSCSDPKPRPIEYGKDQCASCKMGITDKKFGSEVVTNTGKVYVFDALECMLEWASSKNAETQTIHSMWVTDFIRPETLIQTNSACYLESDMIHSPMGLNVAAFADSNECERARMSFVGKQRTLEEVQQIVKEDL